MGVNDVLKRLPRLESVSFAYSPIDDASCKFIADCTRLTTLDLSKTKVGTAGVVELSRLVQLKVLILGETAITDEGLESLSKMSSLESLDLRGCKNITAEGVRKLQMALPKCKIYSDFPDVTAKPADPIDLNAERKAAE